MSYEPELEALIRAMRRRVVLRKVRTALTILGYALLSIVAAWVLAFFIVVLVLGAFSLML